MPPLATAAKPGKIEQRQNDYTGHSTAYDQQRFYGKRNEYLENLRQHSFLKALGPCNGRRVLDVGCGTGRALMYLEGAKARHCIGLDYTPAMLELAERNLKDKCTELSYELMQGDAFALPFEDDSFDDVVSLNFLHMFTFELQQELIGEMHRVCRDGGRIVAEFESIHKGLFVSRYLEQRRVRDRTKFNSAWEIRRLFPRELFANRRTFGTALPVLYRWLCHVPRFGAAVEGITHFPPFNWLAERVFVSATLRFDDDAKSAHG